MDWQRTEGRMVLRTVGKAWTKIKLGINMKWCGGNKETSFLKFVYVLENKGK